MTIKSDRWFPSRIALFKKGIISSITCELCLEDLESSLYLWDYPIARAVRAECQLSLAKLNTNPVSFQDLCADVRLQFSSPDMSCLDTLTTQNMAKLNFAGVRLMNEHQWILGAVV